MAILKKTLIENEEKNVKIENILWDSSNVLKTSYNFETLQLYTTFKKGGVFIYNKVPHSIYNELLECKSIGSFINLTIKPTYVVMKKGVAEDDDVNIILNEINEIKNKKIEE